MTDDDETENSPIRSTLWMFVAGLGIVMTGGAIVGFTSEMNSAGDNLTSGPALAALGIFIAIIAALGYTILRNARKMKQGEYPLTRREKLNNRILIGSGLFGGVTSVILSLSGTDGADSPDVFSNAPISPVVAVVLAFAIGVLLPLLSYYWHKKVIDEQEEAAYRQGALFAIYAFWFAAPVWWLLWRGGILPEPNGIALYMMTTFVSLIVWSWKKYR